MRTERDLQQWIQRRCKTLGILCYKFVSPARPGVPHLLCLYHGTAMFIKVKSPAGTGRISPRQQRIIDHMREAGETVHITDSTAAAERQLRALCGDVSDEATRSAAALQADHVFHAGELCRTCDWRMLRWDGRVNVRSCTLEDPTRCPGVKLEGGA